MNKIKKLKFYLSLVFVLIIACTACESRGYKSLNLSDNSGKNNDYSFIHCLSLNKNEVVRLCSKKNIFNYLLIKNYIYQKNNKEVFSCDIGFSSIRKLLNRNIDLISSGPDSHADLGSDAFEVNLYKKNDIVPTTLYDLLLKLKTTNDKIADAKNFNVIIFVVNSKNKSAIASDEYESITLVVQ